MIAEDKTTSIASEGIDAVCYHEFLFGIIRIRAKVMVPETKSGYLGLFFDSWSDFNAAASTANLHLFPPSNGGYQAPGTPSGNYSVPSIVCFELHLSLSRPGNIKLLSG